MIDNLKNQFMVVDEKVKDLENWVEDDSRIIL